MATPLTMFSTDFYTIGVEFSDPGENLLSTNFYTIGLDIGAVLDEIFDTWTPTINLMRYDEPLMLMASRSAHAMHRNDTIFAIRPGEIKSVDVDDNKKGGGGVMPNRLFVFCRSDQIIEEVPRAGRMLMYRGDSTLQLYKERK